METILTDLMSSRRLERVWEELICFYILPRLHLFEFVLSCSGTDTGGSWEGTFLKGRSSVILSTASLEQFHRSADSSTGCSIRYSGHVDSIIFTHSGLLHYSLLHPNISGSVLKAHTLRLFCSLLVNRCQPDSNRTGGATDPASKSRVTALRHLLDGRKEQQQQQTESGDQKETSASCSCTDSESGILDKLATTASSEVSQHSFYL